MDDEVRAQACERLRGQETCPFHHEHKVTSLCKTCGILVCFECIISVVHDEHSFRKIKDCLREPNDNITKYLDTIDKKLITAVEKELHTTKVDRNNAIQTYRKGVKTLKEQETKFRKDIEKTTNSMVNLMDKHLQEVLESLDKHEHALESHITTLRKEREDYAEILEKGPEILRYDAGNEVEQKSKTNVILPYPNIVDLEHTACKDAENLIAKAMGLLKQIDRTISTPSNPPAIPRSTTPSTVNPRHTPPATGNVHREPHRYSSVKTRHSFGNSYPLYYPVIPVSPDTAWTSELIYDAYVYRYYPTKTLYNISNTGESLCRFTKGNNVGYLSVHPTTRQLYGEFGDSTISMIDTTNGNTTAIIHCDIPPTRFTVTRDDHVLIGTVVTDSVYRYRLTGERVNKSTEKYKAFDIDQCDMTNRVAVSCRKEGLVILDTNLTKIHTFTGLTGQNRKQFNCSTAIFDTHGNLIVGDYDNKEIYVVDGEQYTLTQKLQIDDMACPDMMRLCQNILWVTCFDPHKVMCIEME